MRVLVLTADHAPGTWSGIGVVVSEQVAAVARHGVEVDVILPPGQAVVQPVIRMPRLRIRSLSPARFPIPPEALDLVHLHSLGFSELALRLQSRFALPLVYTAHARLHVETPRFACLSGWGSVQERVLASSDHVLFPSFAERNAAVTRSAGLRTRSSVLSNGISVGTGPPSPDAARGPIVFAGRFTETKGLLLLSEIVERLGHHADVGFVLAGGHGDAVGAQTVAALLRRHPTRCRSLGWLAPAALERILRRASMVLVPSRYEPFGMIALEAMRAGAPVIAAAVGGLREIVRPGSGGLLVESRDPGAWCDAILRLRHSPKLRAELARAGPRYVAERYDPDHLSRSLVDDVYRPLATRRPALATIGAT